MATQQEELKTIQIELNEFKEQAEQGVLGGQQPSEDVKTQLESINLKLTEAEDKLDDMQKESAQLREQLEQLQSNAADKPVSAGEVDSKL